MPITDVQTQDTKAHKPTVKNNFCIQRTLKRINSLKSPIRKFDSKNNIFSAIYMGKRKQCNREAPQTGILKMTDDHFVKYHHQIQETLNNFFR